MPRLTPLLAALLALGCGPAAARAVDAPAPTRPAATLDACRVDGEPGGPSLTATGALPAAADLPGATLQLRFVLLARRPGEPELIPVDAGDPAWVRSAPGAAGLVWSRTFDGLAVPATYRVRIRMRWVSGGRVARVTTRTTTACRQPAPTP